MAEQRLPIIDGDDGQWGEVLNQFIEKEHHNTGLDDPNNGQHKTVTIRPGAASPGSAPLKFTSGPLLTVPEPGAVEFLADRLFFTATTGSVRKTIAAYNDAAGATGDIYYRNGSGNFTRLGIGSEGEVLRVSDGLPRWASSTVRWGGITGDLSSQSDLQSALNSKLDSVVAGANIAVDNSDPRNPVISAESSGPGTDAVKLTGDQTISGIKTFTSSPVIPEPTTDSQAATRKFVLDNAVEGSSAAWGTISGTLANQTDLAGELSGRMADGVWATSNTYYVAPVCQGINEDFVPTFNKVYLYPLFIPAPVRGWIQGVSFKTVTGTIMIRQAAFASDAAGKPVGEPLWKHSSTRTAAGPHNQVIAPRPNVVGKIWLATKVENTSGTAACTVRSATGGVMGVMGATSVSIPLVTGYPGIAWQEAAGDFGPAPTESSFLYGETNIPRAYIRVSDAI